MNRSPGNICNTTTSRTGQQAHTRISVLIVACFLAGVATGAVWIYQSRSHAKAIAGSESRLTPATTALLQRLDSPVEIRFYSLLDPATTSDSLRAFAARVDQVLSEYQRDANGRIKVTRYDSYSSSSANAAMSDGVKPFNMDKGDACFLGITVVHNGHKESLSYLSPDWEQAFEPDLTRAIARATEVQPGFVPPQADPAVLDSVKRAIPNLDSVSLEEGTRILRDAALAEFTQAAQEMQAKLSEAQQSLLQAQNGQSDADPQLAMKQLQQLQADQTEKLKEIAANSKVQIDALKQLKAASH